ncbi:alkaline phosphatase [Roseimaritima ulvae]|uniref:Alkaline phosphatase n=1 Tax=Roseimaritima ulvae TaxID=980254 RepID=A0A5B9QR32_9BACT|nr:alkaline phosphatase [Roseimaritima ulvae]QEG39496.1 Alkaline phosphatase precursor [Roseimaritima ulvae]
MLALRCLLTALIVFPGWLLTNPPASAADPLRDMQTQAMEKNSTDFGHWGASTERYSSWTNHSNRLIPIYTFGIDLAKLREQGSVYRDEQRIKALYGRVPENTLNPQAEYFDQTDVYQLQQQAVAAGKRRIILMIFDGMDWDTTRAASIYTQKQVHYTEGRGNGLLFQDYRGCPTDYGFFVSSPLLGGLKTDVNAQVVLDGDKPASGGYDPAMGGATPWAVAPAREYLLGMDRTRPHTVTDSASSATSMTTGIKTYNASINYTADGRQVEPIARRLQRDQDFAIGAVSSVPFSHATPAAAYANNVSRNDYQDISRDLLGLPSSAHRSDALPGMDVVLGTGWGEEKETAAAQGDNFVPGNAYVDLADLEKVARSGAVVVQRTAGQAGPDVLRQATEQAIKKQQRLIGLFGAPGGNLPYQTADGRFNPTIDMKGGRTYSPADVQENPTLADMATAALRVLDRDEQKFWLMVEAGDVDWANHANNLDNSIGAVLSGDEAFKAIVNWIETHGGWDDTAMILTADHGHYFMMTNPQAIADAAQGEGVSP